MNRGGDPLITLARLDEARARLINIVRSADAHALAHRPESGGWSAVENVRHLLFAEELHLGRYLPAGYTWSAVGVAPDLYFLSVDETLRTVGGNPTTNMNDVLDVWDAVHDAVRAQCLDL